MMKKLHLLLILFSLSILSVNAQELEAAPSAKSGQQGSQALFDILFTHDVGATGSIGANGQAGVIYFNAQYWVSTWASNTIHILDNNGNFIETFDIPGVTGTRSFTTDGTSIYIGTASTQIFQVNPATRAVTSTINITTSSSATARFVTYDATLDGGNGGFWIGNFSNDIASVDMSGNELSVIPAATHGTTAYGGAVDNTSAGGSYLWIYDQNGSGAIITQLQLPSGTPTGVVYDYLPNAPTNNNAGIAGGLFISDQVIPGAKTFVSLYQGDGASASDLIVGLELEGVTATQSNQLSNLSISPNPTNGDVVTISTGRQEPMNIIVFDVLGKKVLDTTINNNQLNISSLNSGVYLVKTTQNNLSITKKLIVN